MNIPSEIRGFAIVFLLPPLLHSQATAAPGFQERGLPAPRAGQQRMHQRVAGIYDDVHEDTVNRALDTQFDRVQKMMLHGVRESTDGAEGYADDDCD